MTQPTSHDPNDSRVKRLDGARIGGYGVVFGAPDITDLEGDYFTADTDFWLTSYSGQPLIYDHALANLPVDMPDDMPHYFVYGKVVKAQVDSVGVWIEAQIDLHNEWVEAVLALIDKGALHWSSGSVPHLVKREPDGRMSSWPIVEMSTTPTPAEPRKTEVVRLKHLVDHQDTAQVTPEAAPDEGARGPSRGTPDYSTQTEQTPGNGRATMQKQKTMEAMLRAAVDANWDDIGPVIEDAVKAEGGQNMIAEALQPLAAELAALAGADEQEALDVLVAYVASKVGGEPPVEDEPAADEDMMMSETLNIDMDELAERIAKKLAPQQPAQPKGAYLSKGVNINLNRDDARPETLARYIRAIRDKDRAYLTKRHDQIKRQIKALGINPDTSGGYLVPAEQSNQIIELLRSQTVVLPLCREVPLNRDTLQIPKLSTGATVAWIGENSQISDNSPTFGQITLVAKKLATLVKISNELLEDSDPSVDAIIREDMGRAMGNEVDRVILLGAGGANEPRGLLNHADVTKTALNAAPTYANMLGAVSRVDVEDVSTTPEWQWVFNPREKASLAVLDDDRGGYIWTEMGSNMAMVGGYPPTLLGYPWHQTTQLDVDSDNNDETEIFFGQWNDVIVGMRKSIEIVASSEAGTSFEYDQTWIRAILRMDVNIRHAESIEILTDVRAAS